ncbi:MAG: PD-(D/E)XK nuclease family protein [Flavobacteriaceae bacterium]
MITYLEEIVSEIINSQKELHSYIFVLPSRRACTFLKKELLSQNKTTQFSSQILSIEAFIETIADLKIASSIELLFEFYDAYLKTESIKEKESFESFSSWASVLLDDFNEIDRNLIDRNKFFNYLSDIQEMEHWYVNEQKTPLIQNYLSFWNSLSELYFEFTKNTHQNGKAHQGYVYREAVKNMEYYTNAQKNKNHVFIGFNALNKAEETIIKELLEAGNTEVFWDADTYFMDRTFHSASLFLREIKSTWKYYKTHPFKHISNHYSQPKTINITQCSGNIGQVKCVSKILESIPENHIEKTALVLADETLLLPVLNSLPQNIKTVNITMGFPLKSMPATSFFELFFKLHKDNQTVFYYKETLQLINHPLGKLLFPESSIKIEQLVLNRNLTMITYEMLKSVATTEELGYVEWLFSTSNQQVSTLIINAKNLLLGLKEIAGKNPILIETLYKLNEVWNKLQSLNERYNYIKTTKTLYSLFLEITSITSLDFRGEPYQGLQIMGLLETRSLDFEKVILVSTNEGILPAGKSNKSFITFDLKKEYNLPTHTEKDAVYTYHFYSLLHRASSVNLLYNNHTSGIQAGEKSRFLLQMTHESPESHHITENIFSPKISIPQKELKKISKTPQVINKLKELAEYGFSPSGLTTYIRNPIDFYNRYILEIKELDEMEETIAANTLGTIVHDTLQHLFTPYLNTILTKEVLKLLMGKVDAIVSQQFEKTYKDGNIKTGKNHIIFEISKRYVHSFLRQELNLIEANNKIIITQIESMMESQLKIPELDFPVKLRGMVDRIDIFNETTRIIDYKTGKVSQSDLNLIDWDELMADYKHSKKIQVLTYALMTGDLIQNKFTQAGIISFKNLKEGFMPFTKKENSRGKGENTITPEILTSFKGQLSNLIIEICNPAIPFTEKELPNNDYY